MFSFFERLFNLYIHFLFADNFGLGRRKGNNFNLKENNFKEISLWGHVSRGGGEKLGDIESLREYKKWNIWKNNIVIDIYLIMKNNYVILTKRMREVEVTIKPF